MSDDKTILAPVEVPGMQINFQSPIGPSGKIIAFVLGVDALLTQKALDERLDVIAAAARRQDAFEQLRLDQQSLRANRKLLAKAKAARNAAQHGLDAKLAFVPRGGKPRRIEQDPTKVAPHDANAVMQHDQRITEIEGQIAGCEERIPFWKAILRGEEPLDIDEPSAMAAE